MTSSEPCSPDVAALVGEPVARGVHDGEVGAAGRVGEQRQDPLGGVRVGVVDRAARPGRGDLPRHRAGRPSGPRWRPGRRRRGPRAHRRGAAAPGRGGWRRMPRAAISRARPRARGRRCQPAAASVSASMTALRGRDIGGSQGAHRADSRAFGASGAHRPLLSPVEGTPPAVRPACHGDDEGGGRPTRSGSDHVPRLEGCTGVPRGRHRRWCWERADAGFEGDPQGAPALRSSAVRRSVAPAFVRERALRS